MRREPADRGGPLPGDARSPGLSRRAGSALSRAGFLRLFQFKPVDGVIEAYTYSPWLDEFEEDADSRFTIEVDFFERFGPELADFDADGDVDLADAATLTVCLSGPDVPAAPGCEPADLDCDGDADLADAARLHRRFSPGGA